MSESNMSIPPVMNSEPVHPAEIQAEKENFENNMRAKLENVLNVVIMNRMKAESVGQVVQQLENLNMSDTTAISNLNEQKQSYTDFCSTVANKMDEIVQLSSDFTF